MLLAGAALGLHVGAPARSPVASRAAVTLQAPVAEELTFEERCRRAGVDPKDVPAEPTLMDWVNNMPFAMSKNLARQTLLSQVKDPEPLPEIWDWFWDAMPFLRPGKPGEPLGLGDVARTFKINIEQIFGNIPAPDGAPLAAADVEGLDFQALFLGMKTYFDRYGSLFKMCFGPKSFMVVTDPVVARHILRENVDGYDKGALALVLEDIMGKGLIPADPETWAKRRRAIAPGFHKLYLERMVDEFGQANANLIPQLVEAARSGKTLDMEERFGSLALDVIGKAVFNYDFGSVQEESPVVKAAIRTLGEVEHRALTPAPYWKIPGAKEVIPRLVEFEKDMDLLNSVLYKLIDQCLESRDPLELDALQVRESGRRTPARPLPPTADPASHTPRASRLPRPQSKDYSKVKDPSMLRFLVDLRGEEVDNTQARDPTHLTHTAHFPPAHPTSLTPTSSRQHADARRPHHAADRRPRDDRRRAHVARVRAEPAPRGAQGRAAGDRRGGGRPVRVGTRLGQGACTASHGHPASDPPRYTTPAAGTRRSRTSRRCPRCRK